MWLFIVGMIIGVLISLFKRSDSVSSDSNFEQNYTNLTPEEIEKYEQEESKEISKNNNDSDYYDSPYDIDFEDDPYRRTEKIYALHEEALEELDDYYDEEYDLNSGLYDNYDEDQEDDLW